jgi:hypothetical protein
VVDGGLAPAGHGDECLCVAPQHLEPVGEVRSVIVASGRGGAAPSAGSPSQVGLRSRAEARLPRATRQRSGGAGPAAPRASQRQPAGREP